MNLQNPIDLLTLDMQDLYKIKKEICKALPISIDNVHSPQLKGILSDYLIQAKDHMNRIEDLSQTLGINLDEQSAKSMGGILEDAARIQTLHGDTLLCDLIITATWCKLASFVKETYNCALLDAGLSNTLEYMSFLQTARDDKEQLLALLEDIAEEIITERELDTSDHVRLIKDNLLQQRYYN